MSDSLAANELLITLVFRERDGRTTQTFHQSGFASSEARDRHIGGWDSAFDKLQPYANRLNKETPR